MYTVSVEDWFAAAHYLRNYNGKCENLHGHNYKVKVYVSGTQLTDGGMLMDFSLLKKALKSVLDEFDHKDLNSLPYFTDLEPSAENISCLIFQKLKPFIPANGKVSGVEVFETEKNSCLYSEDY
ncbi:MAG: 6-carboxytetrahydropterin synthase QueD [Spirochaetia bacterium]|nr:6-carboxytetrahydropterin synthase QueD [Spirochaetia bacterium]